MKKIDFLLLGVVTLLTLFGLLMIYDASSVRAFVDFNGDKYHFLRDQAIWVILGFIVLFIFSFFDYHKLYNLALPLLVIALICLILVFLPGIGAGAKGANRWINLHFITLQPAEFVKLSLAIYLAAWFSNREKERFLAFSLLVGTVLLFILLEPDLGTASIVLFEAIVIYFLSGGSIKHFVISLPIIGFLWLAIIKIEPYRASRLTSFLNINNSLNGVDYHVKQILIALGSGGIFGLGIGNSRQKYGYLPESMTDAIFPIIAEELGFIGASVLILLFMIIVWRGFFIAMKAKDNFGRLLAAGIISFLGMQIVINLGAMTVLFPLTGVPLPFVSYGGSALIIDMTSIGILLNISKQMNK
jgi:cell division protein FtsW